VAVGLFAVRDEADRAAVRMTGVKMGDRLVHVGGARPSRLVAMALEAGLSGRAVAIVPPGLAEHVQKSAARSGALVEIETASPTALPFDGGIFDLAVVDDTDDFIGDMRPEADVATIREVGRVLRPGGRIVFIGRSPRGGLGRLLMRTRGEPPYVASGEARAILEADGFRSVRQVADREGLLYVEAVKPR
jgi:SAM-dependent methyltransferase